MGGQRLNPNTLWQCYREGKQSVAQYGCSPKAIRRYLTKAACWVRSRMYPYRWASFTKSKSSCAT